MDLEHEDSTAEGSEFGEEDDETERNSIRKELSGLSFEELQALKQELGSKAYNLAMFGSQKKQPSLPPRANKNRPREVSSKVPVGIRRNVVEVKKKVVRDPRFHESSGSFKKKAWKEAYDFIEEMKEKEMKLLRKQLKDPSHDGNTQRSIHLTLQRMENQKREALREEMEEKQKEEEKQSNIQRMKEGKKPFFTRKSTRRKQLLKEKFEDLQKKGQLEKYIKNKRKRLAARDRKHVL